MRYEPGHKQKTRDRMLAAAATAIRTEGAHGMSLARVMALAGLTLGGFYAHFASKDELIATAIGRMFDEQVARVVRETNARSPGEALAAHIDSYLSPAHRDARTSGCPMPVLASELPHLTEPARQQFAAGLAAVERVLATLLARLGHAAAESGAMLLVAELVGAMTLARAQPAADRSDAMLAGFRAVIKRRVFQEIAA